MTKVEAAKKYIENGNCIGIDCRNCPANNIENSCTELGVNFNAKISWFKNWLKENGVKKLEVGKKYYVNDLSKKQAVIGGVIMEYRGTVDNANIYKSECGNYYESKYAVPVEPEEPEYVDVEVSSNQAHCPYCKSLWWLHELYKDPHYAGIVWEENGRKVINNQTVMWRNEGNYLCYDSNSGVRKLERANKVLFVKEGE